MRIHTCTSSSSNPTSKMVLQAVIVLALVAVARAGYAGVAYSPAAAVSHVQYSSPYVSYGSPYAYGGPYAAAPTITSQSQNILRSFGNLGQVSTYSKSIDTPFSSVQKSDIRVSNPGYKFAAPAYAPATYAAPAYAPAAYAAPAYAPAAYAAPAYPYAAPAVHAPAAIGVAYSAAPAVAKFAYTGSYGLNYGF